jgi:flagellar basal body-associated protein FliL
MNTRIEPPPKRGAGYFAKGCLILIVLAILLVVVGVGGTYWSLRHVYLSDKPAPIPEANASTETNAAAPGETTAGSPTEKSAEVRERLDTMKQAARAHEQTGVELTAADINALIAANRKSRGAASVGINGNVAQAQFSIPLQRLDVPFRNALGLGDRYLNGAFTIVAPPGTNASSVRLSEVTINGHSLPSDPLDWGVPGVGKTLRTYVIKYANQYGVTDGEIRDGKVILHTSGH